MVLAFINWILFFVWFLQLLRLINFKFTVLIMIILNFSKNSFENSKSFIFKSLLLLRVRWWNVLLGKRRHTFFILFLRFLNCLILILWFQIALIDFTAANKVVWLEIKKCFTKWIFSWWFPWRIAVVNRQYVVLINWFFLY